MGANIFLPAGLPVIVLNRLPWKYDSGTGCAMCANEFGFVVEQVAVRRGSVHEQVDHAFRFGEGMRQVGESTVGSCVGRMHHD